MSESRIDIFNTLSQSAVQILIPQMHNRPQSADFSFMYWSFDETDYHILYSGVFVERGEGRI